MSRRSSPPDSSTAHPPLTPDPTDGLSLIKPAVRAQRAYSLASPAAKRKLNQNESPFDFPDELKREVLDQAAGLPWQRYPEFTPPELLSRLATHFGWVPDGVLVGNGSNELIQATLSVALGAGDRVVAPSPTFSLYRLLTAVYGGAYVPVPLGDRFAYDVDRLIDTANRERAQVIVLNSPNNPTGSALPEDAVERILQKTEALVLCDEAYQDFGGPTAIPLLSRWSRLVVLRTFSKALGLAGMRFGLALADPEVAREIIKGKLPYNVNLMTLIAARVALGHTPVFLDRTRQVVATRDRFVSRLERITGLTVYPSAANFVLFRCNRVPAKEVFRRLRDEHGILIRDVSDGPNLDQCLRVSIGTDEDMDAVIGALERVIPSVARDRPG